MKQYIVDAFTNKPFSGNPAAVCVMDEWPAEEFMRNLAMENNLSETAFIVKEETAYHLRWFTPGTEVELCGHATMASAFVILNYYEPDADVVEFDSLSGRLTVTRRGNLYEMDFPTFELKEIPVTDLICVFDSEEQVREMKPDQSMLMQIEGRIQNATARGTETDCVSRSFCPKLSIKEDPVCGSAHVQIADYWAAELGKNSIDAYQASKRGGYLHCVKQENGRMAISGEAVLVAVSDNKVDMQR